MSSTEHVTPGLYLIHTHYSELLLLVSLTIVGLYCAHSMCVCVCVCVCVCAWTNQPLATTSKLNATAISNLYQKGSQTVEEDSRGSPADSFVC